MQASDPREIIHQLEYRIEAGSIRKPNKDRDVANMQQAVQQLFAPFWNYGMQTMNFGETLAQLARRQSFQQISVVDHQGWLMHRPNRILTEPGVHAGLAANRTVHHRQKRGWNLHV